MFSGEAVFHILVARLRQIDQEFLNVFNYKNYRHKYELRGSEEELLFNESHVDCK